MFLTLFRSFLHCHCLLCPFITAPFALLLSATSHCVFLQVFSFIYFTYYFSRYLNCISFCCHRYLPPEFIDFYFYFYLIPNSAYHLFGHTLTFLLLTFMFYIIRLCRFTSVEAPSL